MIKPYRFRVQCLTADGFNDGFTNTESLCGTAANQSMTYSNIISVQCREDRGRQSAIEGLCFFADKGAVLPGQRVIQLLLPFRLEENVEEDRNHCQEAGDGRCSHHQPSKCSVCKDGHEVNQDASFFICA